MMNIKFKELRSIINNDVRNILNELENRTEQKANIPICDHELVTCGRCEDQPSYEWINGYVNALQWVLLNKANGFYQQCFSERTKENNNTCNHGRSKSSYCADCDGAAGVSDVVRIL